jgi:putative phosphoribosyl transferase
MNELPMFRDRADAGRRLAELLKGRSFVRPVVLAIPRGGVVTGVVIAKEIGAELDVVLSRKLRAPLQPELAIGSISEDGRIDLAHFARKSAGVTDEYLAEECGHQLGEIERRKRLFRKTRPAVALGGRSVIVTDDGIATGATMIAALRTVRAKKPKELIVAVPLAAPERLEEVGKSCDEVVCLQSDSSFDAVGQFYEDFAQVDDDEAAELLGSTLSPANNKRGKASRLAP